MAAAAFRSHDLYPGPQRVRENQFPLISLHSASGKSSFFPTGPSDVELETGPFFTTEAFHCGNTWQITYQTLIVQLVFSGFLFLEKCLHLYVTICTSCTI